MAAMLEVQNLCAGYGAPVVKDISFTVESGELVGLLGRNGSGKTTLLRSLTGSAKVTGGRVLLDGEDWGRLSHRQRACRVALMPQRPQLLPGLRAREVLEMGRYPWTGPLRPAGEEGRKRVAQAARQFGLEELLDTDCAALSEGQRQMVHLGRAVVQDAPVLLLDEPNSALDFYNTQLLFQTVGELIRTQRKAGLVVLHDPALALTWCRRLLLLRQGELVGEVCPAQAGEEEIQAVLRRIYPDICVKRDKDSGAYWCGLAENGEK